MDATHLHLLFNHLPIIGSVIGGLILLYALLVKSDQTILAAYSVLVFSAIGGIITYSTGEGAEETVEQIAGISEAAVSRHEDLAFLAFIAVLVVGIGSLIGLILQITKSMYAKNLGWVTFFASLIAFSILAGAGYTGGQIRHTELSNSTIQNIESDEEED